MINSVQIQESYNELYSNLRNYLWPFNVVEQIADLEIMCYRAIPNIQQIRNALQQIRFSAARCIRKDEDLASSFERMENLIRDDDTSFKKLLIAKEVVS